MISISTTNTPATDLGYLLHKNPGRVHDVPLSFGKGLVVFPVANEQKCTATLLIEIDPVGLVRSPGGTLSQYVNDRPYVASSFLSTAISKAFGTAMSGRCKDRPELAATAIPLEVEIPVLTSRLGDEGIRKIFEPLGYEVFAEQLPLDPKFPEWGDSNYFRVSLRATQTVRALLQHLYVLLPVLDARKHYFLNQQEVDKLLAKGEGWLASHPLKDWIVRSYLGRKTSLIRVALEQLANAEPELEVEQDSVDSEPMVAEAPAPKKSITA